MRSGYVDDINQQDLAMWRGRVASSIRGKRGQAMLKMLLKALDDMPEKRLIADELVDNEGSVCLLGAGGKAIGIADIDKIDPEEHGILATRFNVASCLIQEIEFINDEAGYGRNETPEERYARVRKWLVEIIKVETVAK